MKKKAKLPQLGNRQRENELRTLTRSADASCEHLVCHYGNT